MQDGAPVTSAGRKLERVSNGAPRGMTATRVAFSDVARAQNPAYRLALPPNKKCRRPCGRRHFYLCALARLNARLSAQKPTRRAQPATISNECVSSAVFAIMIDAEQYLSCDRLIARSTVAGFRFLPVTVKWK
jgi:hypothetical protein